jgi:2-polyprenyl-6-methoxyphenol hydroxylase-like FAD-dependent oxidoreductase
VPEGEQFPDQVDVVVVGAGPVGATLALDLARRGVRTLVVERDPEPRKLPKMERCNPRSMEIFRRLGVAETLRSASLFTPLPMDVFVVADLRRPPLLHLRYPSVPEARDRVRATTDGSLALEPQQLISQYTVEPVLRDAAVRSGAILRTGTELVSFEQDAEGVTASLSLASGATAEVRSRWIVGCDGGVSTVRKQLGIKLEGDGRIRLMRQVFFRSETFFDTIPAGKGRHYYFPSGTLIVQDDLKHFVVNFADWTPGQDALPKLRELLSFGEDFDIEVLSEADWYHHLLLAERYRHDRAFIAGDAAHLVIPNGGLGMNTGVGDAIDLGWKLAAAVHGYGGEVLLESYETERRQVGFRNREASRASAEGVGRWRRAVTPAVHEDGGEGDRARAEISALAAQGQRIGHELLGVEVGYRYSESPVVFHEDVEIDPDICTYTPTATPGARLPHMWLEDGSPIQDSLGPDYTLLCVAEHQPESGDLARVVAAFAHRGAPLAVTHLHEAGLRRVYEASLLLLRPDLHVVWRGDSVPEDVDALVGVATGLIDVHTLLSRPTRSREAEPWQR